MSKFKQSAVLVYKSDSMEIFIVTFFSVLAQIGLVLGLTAWTRGIFGRKKKAEFAAERRDSIDRSWLILSCCWQHNYSCVCFLRSGREETLVSSRRISIEIEASGSPALVSDCNPILPKVPLIIQVIAKRKGGRKKKNNKCDHVRFNMCKPIQIWP